MSFSKAKVQRFNEFGNDVPPPGAYDPKFDDKIKGLAIHKSERFNEKHITSSEHNLSLSNKSINKTITNFKTPQPPQRSTSSKSCTKLRPRSIIPSPDTKSHYNIERELADLQVECFNKDKTIQEYVTRTQNMQETIQEYVKRTQDMQETIKEHEKRAQDMQGTIQEHEKRTQDIQEIIQEHVKRAQGMQEIIQEHEKCTQDMQETIQGHVKRSQDMQGTIQKLESQLEELHRSHADTLAQNKKNIEAMVKLQQEILDKHIERHKSELEHLQKQLQDTCAERAQEVEAGKDIENDLRNRISDLLEKINKLEFELANQKHISEDKIQSLEKQNEESLLALNEANIEIEELTDTIRIMEEEGNGNKEDTEALEQEKARREALEEEKKKLLEYIACLKKDYEEISEKYAELIGHQNHKQRIKHVSQLKDKINQLEEDLRLKAKKIEQQRKIIDKLNPAEKRIPNKFKENFLKMMKDETTTPEASPMKPCTPLRIIND